MANAKDQASVADSDYDSVVAGTDTVYVLDVLSSEFRVPTNLNGTAGNVQVVDATAGGASTTSEEALQFFGSTAYIRVVGGAWESTSNRTVDFYRTTFCELRDAHVRALTDGQTPIRMWGEQSDVIEGNAIDNCEIFCHVDYNNAVQCTQSTTAGHTSIYKDTQFTNNTVWYGKFMHLVDGSQVDQLIRQDGRRGEGWLVEGNTFHETESNSVQLGYTAGPPAKRSVVRNNTYVNCGRVGPLVNVVQTGWNFNFLIDNETVQDPRNPGGTGDGHGIILDYEAAKGSYADGITVRRCWVDDANEAGIANASGIKNWTAKNSDISCNLVTNSTQGVGLSDGYASLTFTLSNISTGNPTVLTYSEAGGKVIETGDSVTISGVSGNTPDINSTYTATYVSDTQCSIPVNTTSAGTGGVMDEVRRISNCDVYCNTLVDNDKGVGCVVGPQYGTVYGNIIKGGDYGIWRDNSYGAQLPTEDYNCFYGIGTEEVYDFDTGLSVAANSMISDPLFVDEAGGDYNLQSTSPCVSAGPPKWWGNGARPQSRSGEPVPDTNLDIGAYQSTHYQNHPVNL